MTAYRIAVSSIARGGQTEGEIWADSKPCQNSIIDLIGPGSPGTSVSFGPVPAARTVADTWCGSCGGFMWHGTDCGCPGKTAGREPLTAPPYAAQCPECGENAVREPPSDPVPWQAHGLRRPDWSHADRSALCPLVGSGGGYEPAQRQLAAPQPDPGRDAGRPDPLPSWRTWQPVHDAEPEAG